MFWGYCWVNISLLLTSFHTGQHPWYYHHYYYYSPPLSRRLIAIDLRGGEKRGLFISPTDQPRATSPHEYVTIFQKKKQKKVPKYSFSCAAVCVCSISKNCPLTRPYRNAIGNLYKNVYKMLYKMCARACNSALRPGKVGATLIKRGILDFIFIAVIMCASVAQHTVCTVYIIIYYYVLCTRVHLVFHRVIYFYAWNFVRNTDHRPSGLCSLRSV